MSKKIYEALAYDDVLLVPQYSDIESRSQVHLTTDMGGGLVLELPIIASPMDTISGPAMCTAMDKAGGVAVVHRYNSVEEQADAVSTAVSSGAGNVGAAVGVTGDYLLRATTAMDLGANFVCVDVAHGHHILVKKAIQSLRAELGSSFHIMAGNVATLEGFDALAQWGADSIRCNIGGGSICTTRIQTGHGVPGLHTLFECAASEHAGRVRIIADGGIRTSGDIVKAYAAGADAVMLGSMLAGTRESTGELIHEYNPVTGERESKKAYRGMASAEAQNDWRGRTSSLEGVSTTVTFKGGVGEILARLEGGIRSGLSYSGATNIAELHHKAKFVRQTGAGKIESGAHVMTRG
tara:strand:+ start:4703 stop:5755 length:1053 start_codon:yes stop_codon:yes gene_type:complete